MIGKLNDIRFAAIGVGRIRRLLAVVLMVGLLTACDSGEKPSSEASSTPGDAPSSQVQSTSETSQSDDTAVSSSAPESAQQVLRVAVDDLPVSQGDPYQAYGSPAIYTWRALFDGLTFVNGDGEVEPALATEWRQTDDTTWEFDLREDTRFSNGEPVDARAVKATFDYLLNDGRDTIVATNLLNTVAAVREVDALTVEIETAMPDPILDRRVAEVFIVPPDAWTEKGADGFAAEPVGSGSYQVESISENQWSMTAYEESWRPPETFTQLEIRNLPEPSSRVSAAITNEVDIAYQISPDSVGQLEDGGVDVEVFPSPDVLGLTYVTEKEGDNPVSDPRVRLALNLAVDQAALVENLLDGLAEPASQGAPPQALGYNADLEPYPYEPERAASLLAEAGYADGFDLTAQVTVGGFPADEAIYQAVQGYLADVGVNLDVQVVDFPTWLDNFINNTWDGSMFNLPWVSDPLLDASFPYVNVSCLKPEPFYCDEEVMPLLRAQATELDPDTRRETLEELQAVGYERPPALFLVEQVDIVAINPDITNYTHNNRRVDYHELGLSEGG